MTLFSLCRLPVVETLTDIRQRQIKANKVVSIAIYTYGSRSELCLSLHEKEMEDVS